MKIVFHHEGILPVTKYGGIERILFWHMCELARLGHEVVLIGNPKTNVADTGIKLIPIDLDQKHLWKNLIPKDTNIVHLFYHDEIENFNTIITMQCNGQPGEKFHINTVFASKKHAENHNGKYFVHNALDLKEYPFNEKKLNWDNFLFLAKASWRVKNLKQIAWASRHAKKHLWVVGGRWFGLSRFIHNLGMLGGEEKTNAIKKCDALIFTVRWHEPFGIAIIEAMAHGLPVIGSPYGSLPEIINETSGIIVSSKEELKNVLKSPPKKFDPLKIRNYIEEHFSISVHTKKYLELYEKVISGEKLNSLNPEFVYKERAENLLPF
jgi:hypothetical protein